MTLIDELVAKYGAKNPEGKLAHEICDAINAEIRSALEELLERCAVIAETQAWSPKITRDQEHDRDIASEIIAKSIRALGAKGERNG